MSIIAQDLSATAWAARTQPDDKVSQNTNAGAKAGSEADTGAVQDNPFSRWQTTADTTAPQGLQNMFLTLLVAQLKTQDPTAPTNASEYVNQLAMLNQLQATETLVSLQKETAELEQSALIASLGNYVGKEVMVSTSEVQLDTARVHGGFTLEQASRNTTLVLSAPDGTRQRIDLGTYPSGTHKFSMDPAALGLKPGRYEISIETSNGSQGVQKINAEIQGRLQEVRVGHQGQVHLSVEHVGAVGMADITRFIESQGSAAGKSMPMRMQQRASLHPALNALAPSAAHTLRSFNDRRIFP